jgi:hypothetical protein
MPALLKASPRIMNSPDFPRLSTGLGAKLRLPRVASPRLVAALLRHV